MELEDIKAWNLNQNGLLMPISQLSLIKTKQGVAELVEHAKKQINRKEDFVPLSLEKTEVSEDEIMKLMKGY